VCVVDGGDYVVVTNAEKVIFTGDKWKQKLYRWHTGYPGGLKEVKAKDMLQRHPDAIIRNAVSKMVCTPPNLVLQHVDEPRSSLIVVPSLWRNQRGGGVGRGGACVRLQLPKNKLRWARLKRLRIFVGEEHPHEAQVSQGNHFQLRPPAPQPLDSPLAAMREQALADPEAFVRKYGGTMVAHVPYKDQTAIVTDTFKGTHAHAVRTYGNTRSLRAARLERLRHIVEGIQAAQARDAAKREPL